jgi:predicted short-subunit dehydrogenase-like oxidoreductase (DUF2520 family)
MGRDESVGAAASGTDVVLIATPDAAIAAVAAAIEPGDAVVMHCSGATRLTALGPHARRASIHPLMSLPDPVVGAARLAGGGWFAVAGVPIAAELVDKLGGRRFVVDDEHRALYHATAAISANHLVALLAQVERLAAEVGVPFEAFTDLARGSFDDVVSRGPRAALTGPAARGDLATLEAHRAALAPAERGLYDALASAAADLAQPGPERPVSESGGRGPSGP